VGGCAEAGIDLEEVPALVEHLVRWQVVVLDLDQPPLPNLTGKAALTTRQTKEAETDMFDLQPPRHISTLRLGVRSQQMSKDHPVDQPASAKRNGSDESEHMQRTNVAFVDNTEENSLSTFCDARAMSVKS
jgi:hypothetical protein